VHEPPEALFAVDGGLEVIRRIVAGAGAWLLPGGFFGTEIDPALGSKVCDLCAQAGLGGIRVVKYLAGLDRHVVARKP